jgi:hypothetical protein
MGACRDRRGPTRPARPVVAAAFVAGYTRRVGSGLPLPGPLGTFPASLSQAPVTTPEVAP